MLAKFSELTTPKLRPWLRSSTDPNTRLWKKSFFRKISFGGVEKLKKEDIFCSRRVRCSGSFQFGRLEVKRLQRLRKLEQLRWNDEARREKLFHESQLTTTYQTMTVNFKSRFIFVLLDVTFRRILVKMYTCISAPIN